MMIIIMIVIIMVMMMMIPASLFVCRAAVYAIELEAPGDQSLILAQGSAATRADGNYKDFDFHRVASNYIKSAWKKLPATKV